LEDIDMEITKDTRVSAILEEYGDIADVMELFGIRRVGRYSLRMLAAKAVTVEWASRIHRVPLDEFLSILQQAVASKSQSANKKI
jgi:virulence-associated protein VapD